MKFSQYIEKVKDVDVMGIISLAACVLFFTVMAIRVFRTKKKEYTEASRLPLDN